MRMILPHQLLILGAALLALGGLAGPVIAFGLPKASRYRRGIFALLPQAVATLGAAACATGWFVAKRALKVWHESGVDPAPALAASLEKVIAWKNEWGLMQAGFILVGLVLAALPMWRGQAGEKPIS